MLCDQGAKISSKKFWTGNQTIQWSLTVRKSDIHFKGNSKQSVNNTYNSWFLSEHKALESCQTLENMEINMLLLHYF